MFFSQFYHKMKAMDLRTSLKIIFFFLPPIVLNIPASHKAVDIIALSKLNTNDYECQKILHNN